MTFRFPKLLLALVVGISLAVSSARADVPWPLFHYIVSITPRATGGLAATGDLRIAIDGSGLIDGTYQSASPKPDPFAERTITVTGALSKGDIRLEFGTKGDFAVAGTFEPDQGIVGTALSARGQWYDFVAKRVP